MPNPMAASSIPGFGISDIGSTVWGWGTKSIKNKFGQRVLGALASGPFNDFESEYRDAIQGKKQQELSGSEKVIKFLKNNFAWGDIATLAGIFLWWANETFFAPAKDQEPGFMYKLLGIATKILTFGGTPLALIGRMLGLHRERALGEDKIAEMQRAQWDKEGGEKIFRPMDIEKEIHPRANHLKKVLVYPPETKGMVFERSTRKVETAFIHGPPSSGKTTGAIVILSNWARKWELQDHVPVVHQLNLGALEEKAKKFRDEQLSRAEFFANANKDIGDVLRKNIGDPLLVFENLIKEMEQQIQETEEYNKNLPQGQKPKRIAFFIDEYDKIGKMAQATTDIDRLVRVITRVNALIHDQTLAPIILTSNKSIKQIGVELRKIVPEELWNTVVFPHLERLQKVAVFVDDADEQGQAEIAARNLLLNYPRSCLQINASDSHGADSAPIVFGDNEQINIDMLTTAIHLEVTSRFGSNRLNGRQMEEVVANQCKECLVQEAGEKRVRTNPDTNGKRLGYTDDEWERLSFQDRAKAAEVAINISMIRRLVQAQQAERDKWMEQDPDSGYVFKSINALGKAIVKAFIRQNKGKIEPHIKQFLKGKIDQDKLLELLQKIYTSKGSSYYSDEPVTLKMGPEGHEVRKSYKHGVCFDVERGVAQIAFADSSSNISSKTGWEAATNNEVTITHEMPLKEFVDELLSEVFLMFGKPRNVQFFQGFASLLDALKTRSGALDVDKLQTAFDQLGIEFGNA